jgi:hypothetical protein
MNMYKTQQQILSWRACRNLVVSRSRPRSLLLAGVQEHHDHQRWPSPNFFSSVRDNDLIWTNRNRRLLEADSGTWTSEDWRQALLTIRHWTDQETAEEDSVDMAWNMLDRAFQEQRHGIADGRSLDIQIGAKTLKVLHRVVEKWARTSTGTKLTAREVWEKVVLHQSIVPNARTPIFIYNQIMNTAIKHGDKNAHHLAEDIIRSLASTMGNDDDDDGRTTQTLGGPLPPPNVATFNVAINALAKSGAPDAPQRAEALLQQVKDLAARTGRENLKPNNITYNSLMLVWANSKQPGAPRRAEELLMETPTPNTRSFNALLDVWSKSGLPGSADRCYQIFRHMHQLHSTNWYQEHRGQAMPNIIQPRDGRTQQVRQG